MMKTRLFPALILASLVASTSALAETPTDSMFGTWTSFTLTGKVNDKWNWFLSDQARTRDDAHVIDPNAGFSPRLSQNLFWVSFGYKATAHTSWWFGYSQFWNKNLNGTHSMDARPYQDFLWTDHIFGKSGFVGTLRTRAQEVFDVSTTGADIGNLGMQVRQLGGISHPIPGTGGRLAVYLSDEVWFNLNKTAVTGRSGFNQNWAMGGFIIKATDELSFTLGYLGQYVRSETPGGHSLFTQNFLFDIHYNIP